MKSKDEQLIILQRQFTDSLMYIIDSFISLQLRAKNLPIKERYAYITENYRKIIADEFEFRIKKNHIENHPIYLENIRNSESGPYAPTAFDINHQPNLLNL